MQQAKRVLKPQVINVFDNAVVQVKCIPEEDEINVETLIGHSLARFEFIMGTSFDLQFLSMDGTKLLGVRRYIVNAVSDRIAVNDVNHYQTLSKTVFDRTCAPISDWVFFHEEGKQLRKNLLGEEKPKSSDLSGMSPASLQGTMKKLRGKGFPRGTTKDSMMKDIRKHISTAQE